MKISRNWLQTHFDKPIPSGAALAELLTFHSFEVEGLHTYGEGKSADEVLDIKVLPDRAHYCLSHAGIALEISVLTGQPRKANRIPPGPAPAIETKPAIRIDAPKFCRRYIGRYAEISKVPPSNPHACDMLQAIGQRAINLVVDGTNINMFDIGQPLHAFDADKVVGTIVVRVATTGEKIELLDSSEGAGRVVELLETDHVIADDLGPIAIAGVKGGKRTGISATTTRLIIEAANFDPTAVRRTSTRLDLRSESSKRYENEITPELAAQGMDQMCSLLNYTIPAMKLGPVVDVYPVPPVRTVIAFDPRYVAERLGIQVSLAECQEILTRMGIAIEISHDEKLWTLTIPFDRLDLTMREDIVEEIGRVHGYDHIPEILPPKTDKPVPVLPAYYLIEKIKNILVGQGFSEVSLYSLVAKGEIETAKPLAHDKAFLRANLTDGMLSCVEKNALNADLLGLEAIKIFEIGNVFTAEGEKTMLSLGVAQIKKIKGFKSDVVLGGAVQSLAEALGVTMPKPTVLLKGNHAVAQISLDQLVAANALPANASYSDLNFQPLSGTHYQKFSLYPFIVRDIAVFVPESVAGADVWKTIEKGLADSKAQNLLARHALFDTFKKDAKVSYAFRMVFQSMDRTLTDTEINSIMEKVSDGIKAIGWEVR